MHFKLIVAFVEDSKTDDIMDAARELGFVRLTFATRLVPESDR